MMWSAFWLVWIGLAGAYAYLGEYAEHCGSVNLHRSVQGDWGTDPGVVGSVLCTLVPPTARPSLGHIELDGTSGCGQEPLDYCRRWWPSTFKAVPAIAPEPIYGSHPYLHPPPSPSPPPAAPAACHGLILTPSWCNAGNKDCNRTYIVTPHRCLAPPVNILTCPATRPGEYAESCGYVDQHRAWPDGTWATDPDGQSGCNQSSCPTPLAYAAPACVPAVPAWQ
eukprot:gene2092-481_t